MNEVCLMHDFFIYLFIIFIFFTRICCRGGGSCWRRRRARARGSVEVAGGIGRRWDLSATVCTSRGSARFTSTSCFLTSMVKHNDCIQNWSVLRHQFLQLLICHIRWQTTNKNFPFVVLNTFSTCVHASRVAWLWIDLSIVNDMRFIGHNAR